MEEGAGSSELGVRGATTGCRMASEGSCAARADAGVDGSSVAGTEGGGGGEGSLPGSDDEITATSVAGGDVGSRDAETKELEAGFLVYTVRAAASIIRWAATTRS